MHRSCALTLPRGQAAGKHKNAPRDGLGTSFPPAGAQERDEKEAKEAMQDLDRFDAARGLVSPDDD